MFVTCTLKYTSILLGQSGDHVGECNISSGSLLQPGHAVGNCDAFAEEKRQNMHPLNVWFKDRAKQWNVL